MSRKLTLLSLLAVGVIALPAHAAVYTVTKTADTLDGQCNEDCSLREAVEAANSHPGPDVVVLGPGIYNLTRLGAGENNNDTGDLDVTSELTLLGAGAKSTVIDGQDADRLFEILSPNSLDLSGVTLRRGRVTGADGGAILNGGFLRLDRSEVRSSNARHGGGIASTGEIHLTASTIAGNTATESGGGFTVTGQAELVNVTISGNRSTLGGGLYFIGGSDATLTNVTVTANQATQSGGGVYVESTPFIGNDVVIFSNSILAGNTAPLDRDCSGSTASDGYNVLGAAGNCFDFTASKGDQVGGATPLALNFAPLADAGGPTATHALQAGSVAINAGNPGLSPACAATDQRGATRAAAGRCDAGAFELTASCVAGGAVLCLNNDRFKVTATFRTGGGAVQTAQGVTLTDETGYFWFFDPANVEVTVKAINACVPAFNRYWVFLSGLTNVEVTLKVEDTVTGQVKTYTNPQGQTFRTNLDTNAFNTCGA